MVSSDSNHCDNKIDDVDVEIDIGNKQQVDETWGEVYAYCNGDVSRWRTRNGKRKLNSIALKMVSYFIVIWLMDNLSLTT